MAIEDELMRQYADPALTAPPAELMQRGGAYYSTLATQLKALGGVLGLLQRNATEFLQAAPESGLANEAIDAMIVARAAAKKARNFAEADRIRDELKTAGLAKVSRGGTPP